MAITAEDSTNGATTNGATTDGAATSDSVTEPVETTHLTGEAMASKVKELLHEGTVRRIVVKNDADHTVMEIPVIAGVVAAIVAPVLAAVGAVAALAANWKIEVHRAESTSDPAPRAN